MPGSVGRAVGFAVALFVVSACASRLSVAADEPKSTELTPPIISFSLDFPAATPSHYVISIAHDGHATYACNLQPDMLQFAISGRERDQIFELAQRAHYFSGKVDSGRKDIANTGNKTLAYNDGRHDSQATYNYSTNASIEQLTRIFQDLSQTLEFGRRLAYSHKYQKTALDEDLKRMEEMQRENSLGDIQAIAPVLKEIANDQSVMNVSRARALRLMAAGTK